MALRATPEVQVPGAATAVAPRPPTGPPPGPTAPQPTTPRTPPPTQVALPPYPTQTIGGIVFQVSSLGTTDVYAEGTISRSDVAVIGAIAATDVPRVETDFGRPYTGRPKVYALATTSSYTQGLRSILGLTGPNAQDMSATSGVFNSKLSAVLVNWSKLTQEAPISTIRHELTHMMEHQIVPSGVVLPAWFNEGTAELEDQTVGRVSYANQSRYAAASMAATGGLFSISALTSQAQWNARAGTQKEYEYYQAAQMVQLIRDDIGQASYLRIFDLMAQRQTFDQAYLAVSGQSLATFSGSVATRLRALAPAYPGIATAAYAQQLSIQLYGFTPGSSVTLAISGPSRSNSTVTVNEYGFYSTNLGSSWRAGEYSITATGPNGTATVSAVK